MSELLSEDVENYCAFASIERITHQQYCRSVSCYSQHLGRDATRDDLREPPVNRWLADVATRLSAFTVLGRKRGLTPVWNWLAGQGLVPWYNARALRRTKVVYPPVQAWSVSQVRALLDGAAEVPGKLTCGVSGSDLMRAWVLVAYETGLRPSDLYRVTWDQLHDNKLGLVQHKTHYGHAAQLSDAAMAALRPLRDADSSTIFVLGKNSMRRWELKLFAAAADHGFTRRKGQSSGTLRKTHGTEVCRVEGLPTAAQSLGHVDGIRVARQSYCEADAIRPTKPPTALINALKRATRTDPPNHQRRAG